MEIKRLLPILLAFLLMFSGCRSGGGLEGDLLDETSDSPVQEEMSFSEEEDARDAIYRSRREEIFREHADYLGGLSKESMREDLDYFWDTVHTGYPFLGVLERSGVDPEEVYQNSLRKLEEEVESDFDFINLIQWIANSFDGCGHISAFMGASVYDSLLETYERIADQQPHWQVLYDTLNNPVAAEAYARMAVIEEDLEAAYNEIYATAEDVLTDLDDPAGAVQSSGNITTDLLENGTVAYLKINSFGSRLVEQDAEEIFQFYQSVQESTHLIIDITGNGGGADNYWSGNIVNMLLSEPLTWRQYILGNSQAPYNQEYLAAAIGEADVRPIEELPQFPAFQTDDLRYLDSFTVSEVTVEPFENSLRYSGRIWVLVDEMVYSSAESFSIFCKSTGFATLVGDITGGDGGGVDPNIFILPNSGLAYRFSVFYSINPDGSNSEESGTTPDIFTAPGKTPLETCLEEIASLETGN